MFPLLDAVTDTLQRQLARSMAAGGIEACLLCVSQPFDEVDRIPLISLLCGSSHLPASCKSTYTCPETLPVDVESCLDLTTSLPARYLLVSETA